MALPAPHIAVFGTGEPVATSRQLTAGPLSLEWVQGVVRRLCWQGVEVIRGIDCPVRDENWATCPAQITDESATTSTHSFECVQQRVIADGALSCHLAVSGRSDGFLHIRAEVTAQRDFHTNRTGFTVLHPLKGLTGSEMTVRRENGTAVSIPVPMLISPGQLAFDITGLTYRVYGVETSIQFSGDVFEMEDQRNWSDASLKTYCRPLSRPVPYVIAAGSTVRQELEIRLAGNPSQESLLPGGKLRHIPAAAAIDTDIARLQLEPTGERIPTLAVAVDALSIPDAKEVPTFRVLDPRILQLRLDSDTAEVILTSARGLIERSEPQIELQVVIPNDCNLDGYLAHIAERCKSLPSGIARVLALPEAYVHSYQPNGPWPGGPTPRDACLSARRWFPGAQIGGGVLTNFTELNRCRPDLAVCDYVTHGSTALVHAADDRSVVESLEGLSHVYASARAIAGQRDYRLGLVSIGMRSNPYGADVAPNPGQIRVPMARLDPRQRGLFAAAWAVGAVAATEGCNVSSLALASPVGPLGMIYQRASWPQLFYDDAPDATVYPLFHVVRALLQMAGAARLVLRAAPSGIVGIAAESDRGAQFLLANLAREACTMKLPYEGRIRRLDEETFLAATCDPDWLRTSEHESRVDVTLMPCNVAFVDMKRRAA